MRTNRTKKNVTVTTPDNRKYTIKDVPFAYFDDGAFFSTNATVSKVLRAIMKKNGIKTANYKFRSESFSGGTSLDVTEKEYNENVVAARPFVRRLLDMIKLGSFDGMVDMYNYSDNGIRLYDAETNERLNVSFGIKYCFLNNAEGGDCVNDN